MFDIKASVLRLRVIGLTVNEADQIVKLVQKWIGPHGSGEEWTVDRIKAIKVDLLRSYAGLPPTKSHSWIRYRADGSPKGAFGPLFKLPKKKFRVAWNAVMVYTGLVYQDPKVKVTAKQWAKAVNAIRREPVLRVELEKGLTLVHRSPFFVSVRVTEETGSPLVDYHSSPVRRAPKGLKTVPEEESVIDSLRPLIRKTVWTTQNWDILSGTVRGLEKSIVPDLELNLEFEEKAGGPLPVELPEMGLISLIQEAGYKLRFAANPYRVYQQALLPLKTALFRALKRVPNDHTFDQVAAIPRIQKWLQDGFPACSMDLSNCSDNLPLDLQLEMLSRFGVSTRWLQFFRDTCRGEWWASPKPPSWELLKWTVGTPLGLGPTFASFALLHHSIVQDCFQQLEVPKVDDVWPYVIVGDDVVIMNYAVAELYRHRMTSLGVPISEHKTLWSGTTAEFIGRIITSNSVVQGFKWKGRMSDDSFVSFCQQFGPRALAVLSPRQKRVISYIADLPEPQGLGWNPFGIPLSERLTPSIERVWSRDERVRTFMRRSARSNRLLYMSDDKSGTPVPGRETDADFLSSDQEDERLTDELFPGLHLGEALWPNIPSVVLLRELPEDLSDAYSDLLRRTSQVETRKEVSALVVLERKVRRSLNSWRKSPFTP